MWRSSCNIINPADGYPDLLETQCDTFGGSSGSSVYDFDEQTKGRIIYGVNVAENSQFNSSVRITGPLYCWLTGTMGQNC
jgi:V8-like Glu-specific endopeptidase